MNKQEKQNLPEYPQELTAEKERGTENPAYFKLENPKEYKKALAKIQNADVGLLKKENKEAAFLYETYRDIS